MATPTKDRTDDETCDEDQDQDPSEQHGEKRKRLFTKELCCMMYGYGDDQNPYTETVDVLEDLVICYITEITCKAMEMGRGGRVHVEDITFLVRQDPKKFARVRDLLSMNEELKKARKAFDEVKYAASI